MSPAVRADVYRRHTGRRLLTPAQARRDRRKTNRAKRRALDATPPAAVADAAPAAVWGDAAAGQ